MCFCKYPRNVAFISVFFPTKSLVFFSAVQTSYEASSAVSVSLDAGSQQSGPYVVDHDDSTQQGSGIFGWFSGSNFMNKVVEKTKVNELVTCMGTCGQCSFNCELSQLDTINRILFM